MPQKKIKIIDLFSGVGGLSLGAARAGLDVVAAVENDKYAVLAHKKNFPNTKHIDEDITTIKIGELLQRCGLKKTDKVGIIGGPPCQGFSTIGHKDVADPRNQLFVHFFKIVRSLQPVFFLAENVPGIMREENDELRQTAIDMVKDDYVILDPIKIYANDYGCPTTRCRYVFIGYKASGLGTIKPNDFRRQESRVVVREALCGLPSRISEKWQQESQGWRRVKYPANLTEFLDSARNCIPQGVGDPTSISNLIDENMVSGFLGTVHTENVKERFRNVRPGMIDKVSKARRLEWEGFCPTLRAGTGRERGSFQAVRPIHPSAPRVITPREAARLQGFPDWFQFSATKWHSFRQIGNSVCPIMAEKILEIIVQKVR